LDFWLSGGEKGERGAGCSFASPLPSLSCSCQAVLWPRRPCRCGPGSVESVRRALLLPLPPPPSILTYLTCLYVSVPLPSLWDGRDRASEGWRSRYSGKQAGEAVILKRTRRSGANEGDEGMKGKKLRVGYRTSRRSEWRGTKVEEETGEREM
jgi:hypothetical protein